MRDPSGRGPSPRRMAVAGIAMLAATVSVVYLLMLRYTGFFADVVPVTALLTSTGDGLPERADVKFRGVLVGTVSGVEIAAKGAVQQVALDLKPERAKFIPRTVTARVVPNNVFGVTALELVDNGAGAVGLRRGDTVQQDRSQGATELQTTLTTLRAVLDRIQPAKLGRVLNTFADALDPRYRLPGSSVDRLDAWLTTVSNTPGVGSLLGDLGRSAAALQQSAPELVTVLHESVTAARTLSERRANLVALLTTAGGAVDTVNSLFARNPNSGKELVVGIDALAGTLAADPDAIPYAITNLNGSLRRLATTFHWGPRQQMAWSMHVALTPFQQYSAKDCPHYGLMFGPRCGVSGATPGVHR
ncbi:MAG: MCE family protein [Mycobacteriaceae bacterium]|nr:MCE family protein [Mycobacteriaceae bacterium]